MKQEKQKASVHQRQALQQLRYKLGGENSSQSMSSFHKQYKSDSVMSNSRRQNNQSMLQIEAAPDTSKSKQFEQLLYQNMNSNAMKDKYVPTHQEVK